MMALALFGGMILMTDLRLLGWAMRKRSVADVVNQLRVPKRVGFAIAATLGLLLLGTKAEVYYFNIFFGSRRCCLCSSPCMRWSFAEASITRPPKSIALLEFQGEPCWPVVSRCSCGFVFSARVEESATYGFRAECIWRHISLDRSAPWLAPLQILILVAMSSLSLAFGGNCAIRMKLGLLWARFAHWCGI
jgi:hypothetical protein